MSIQARLITGPFLLEFVLSPYFRLTIAALIVIAGSMLAFAASATSTVEAHWSVNRLKGTSQVATHTGATADEAWGKCIAAIPKPQATTTQTSGKNAHTCQTPRYVATETFLANPVVVPPVDCVVSEFGEWSACESGTQTRTRTILTQPANGGAACPVLSESQACEVPQPGQWTFCANEGSSSLCAFTGTKVVRYGADTRWVERTLSNGVICANHVFGDPAPGTAKRCEIKDADPVEEPPPQGILMSWTAPTQNTDGSPITNLTGYAIYHSQDINNLGAGGQFIAVPNATAYRIQLTPGIWYVAVAAVNTDGAISALSNVVQRVVQ